MWVGRGSNALKIPISVVMFVVQSFAYKGVPGSEEPYSALGPCGKPSVAFGKRN